MYNHLASSEFFAIVDQAKKENMAVIGHGVRSVDLENALFAGQSMVAHADQFLYTAFHDQTDERLIPAAVAFTRESGAFVTPNLSGFVAIGKQWGKPAAVNEFLLRPQAEYLSPCIKLSWKERDYVKRSGSIEKEFRFLQTLTKALADGGVPLLLGTARRSFPVYFPATPFTTI